MLMPKDLLADLETGDRTHEFLMKPEGDISTAGDWEDVLTVRSLADRLAAQQMQNAAAQAMQFGVSAFQSQGLGQQAGRLQNIFRDNSWV